MFQNLVFEFSSEIISYRGIIIRGLGFRGLGFRAYAARIHCSAAIRRFRTLGFGGASKIQRFFWGLRTFTGYRICLTS